MSRECMESVRNFKVDKGSAALWWLGQMGFLIKTPAGTILDDFAFIESPKVVNVINAPSPGATAALSIGKEVVERLSNKFK